ncbi:MAG TPA: hypothetical protein VF185_04495 [Patescibacteria group bacterium]
MLKGALKKFSQGSLAKDKKALLLIVLGSISWCITMVKSGVIYSFGMGFWGANGHDGIWHLALINSLSKGSLEMPVFAGHMIQNYHIGFDLLIAVVHRLTSIPAFQLYFQIAPPVMAILIGAFVYVFVKKWKGSAQALWAIFFVYFGGDLGWIITFLRDKNFGGESTFWGQQAVSTLVNPPLALSVLVIFLGLILIWKIKTKFTLLNYLFGIFLFGSLFEIKAYAGILVLGGLFVAGLYELFREKKTNFIKLFVGSTAVSLIVFAIFSRNSTFPFIFQPFWFLESMVASYDRLNWPKLAEAMASYKSQGVLSKFILAYLFAFVIFWIGNMSSRLLGSVYVANKIVKRLKSLDSFDVFFIVVIFGGVAIPTLFLQKSTAWNTIQFFYYSLVFAGVLGGIFIGDLFSKKNRRSLVIFLSVLIVLFTVPTSLSTLVNNYIPGRPPAKVSIDELSALSFLSKQEDGVVLTFPFDKEAADRAINNPPRPLYLYASTSYVAALSNKQVFLEDDGSDGNLDIMGFDWKERRDVVAKFFETLDRGEAVKFLSNNNITYIYLVKAQNINLNEKGLGLDNIFENSEVIIYKVIK